VAAIQANSNNASNILVTTATGDIINSGGSGISAFNAATSVPSSNLISITANGTINSGFDGNGGLPFGIIAGYGNNGSNAVNNRIAGAVTVDSFATISAATVMRRTRSSLRSIRHHQLR
jgi:hypothetical protein